MKKILLLLLVYCLLSKNSFTSSVTVQSVFFVAALIKSGIFDKKKIVTKKSFLTGTFILLSGFAVSAVLTLFCAEHRIPFYINLALTAFCLYLCFYSIIHLIRRQRNRTDELKTTTLICTVLPSISSIGYDIVISVPFTVLLFLIASILPAVTAVITKKDARRHP